MRTLVLILLLAVPAPAFAVHFQFDQTYPDLEFGPALGFARIEAFEFGQEGEAEFFHAGANVYTIVSGLLRLETGPLLEVTPDGADLVYTHAGGGTVSVTFELALPDGGTHHGTFEASLGPYVIRPSADPHGGVGGGSTSGLMGPGLFDRRTARMFGINRHTTGGDASLFLDTYDQPTDLYRVAQAFGELYIGTQVPEPSTIALGVLGLGFLFARRRALR